MSKGWANDLGQPRENKMGFPINKKICIDNIGKGYTNSRHLLLITPFADDRKRPCRKYSTGLLLFYFSFLLFNFISKFLVTKSMNRPALSGVVADTISIPFASNAFTIR